MSDKRYSVGFEQSAAKEIEKKASSLGLTVAGYIRMIVLAKLQEEKRKMHRLAD